MKMYEMQVYSLGEDSTQTYVVAEHDDAALDCAEVLVASLDAHSADVYRSEAPQLAWVGQVLRDGTRMQ